MKHIIWDSEEPDSEIFCDDVYINLKKQLSNSIIVIADLGLWDGRHSGYKMIESGNLASILDVGEGCRKFYYDDEDGDVKCRDCHHDGTNYYTFREVNPGEDNDEFQELIYLGKATKEDIEKYTTSLGGYVCDVYGWQKKEVA